MLGDAGTIERSGLTYLPYIGHIAEDVVLLRDGSLLAMGAAEGVAFEMEEPAIRNAPKRDLNTLLRNIAADNVTLAPHLVRHTDLEDRPAGRFRSPFAAELDRAYR